MKGQSMTQYYLRDTRHQSSVDGKREGVWLKVPPSPALWVTCRGQAQTFTVGEIDFLKKCYPNLEGCEVIPADEEDSKP